MKQKYTITVADMELNIISDAAPDEVENIVGILDRRMRDINLKSPRCTKNEAALLCALSYCSERIAMQEAFKKVEKDAFRFAADNEKLKKQIEALEQEVANLRKDAEVMRSILDHAAQAQVQAQATKPAAKDKYIQKSQKEESAEQLSAFDAPAAEQPTAPVPSAVPAISEVQPAPAAEPVKEETVEEAPAKASKPANKNRVGSMFDLLTFSDV